MNTVLLRKAWLLFLIPWVSVACQAPRVEQGRYPLVSVSGSGLVLNLKYFSGKNLVGEPLDGYQSEVCLLVPEAAQALHAAAASLSGQGLGLLIYDCYRPQRAVNHFVRWASEPEDFSTKPLFYPHEQKHLLFERGYIAQRSGHSRGATTDLGLYDLHTGRELNMGTRFDFMDASSATDFPLADSQAMVNRHVLRTAMTAQGFVNYDQEWWHYTFKPEPFPETYFDFPVR